MNSKAKTKTAAPRWTGPWLIHFFKRHRGDDASEAAPCEAFLDACPPSVRAKLIAIIKAVADAPPPMFSGGGEWEAMHDEMSGFYEVRADGEGREHFRLFCSSIEMAPTWAWAARASSSSPASASPSGRPSRPGTTWPPVPWASSS